MENVGIKRYNQRYPIKIFEENQCIIGFGSDWPVSTADPFACMQVAVTHLLPEDNDQQMLKHN